MGRPLRLLSRCGFGLLLLHGCASPGAVSRSEMNRTIEVRYGRLVEAEPVDLESDVGSGAVLGGVIGAAAADRGDRVEAAAAGAILGGILARIAEGDPRAWAYTVELAEGSTVRVVTEQEHVEVGHCVSFEQGAHTNVRQVSETACDGEGLHPEAMAAHEEDAARCHAAKDELVAAQGPEAVDAAVRKVQALCNH